MMKRWLYLLPVTVFLSAGCLMQSPQTGTGAGLSPAVTPAESGGMAGPASGAAPAAGPSADAPPAGGSGDGGDVAGAPPPTDPTAGNETPMTIVGTPMGGSRKPKPCPENFRLCFHDLTVTPRTGGGGVYDVAGILGMQTTPGGAVEGVGKVFVYLIDLLFPDQDHTTATNAPAGDFVAIVTSTPGRVLRFQIEVCKRMTTLDVTLPEESGPPVALDPCGGTDPTDVSTGTPPRGSVRTHIPIDDLRQFEMKAQ